MNLIVFDIDDTLTQSEYQHQLAYINTMKEFGITEINQNWSEYLHHTDSYILKENYERNFSDSFEFDFINDFETRMTALILDLPQVSEINGAKKIIKQLRSNTDYAICFATGSLLQPAFVKLAQAGIPYEDNLVVGSNGIYEREGIVQKAIQKARDFYKVTSFEHIISVGDGIWDLMAARNLDIHFIGIGMKNYDDFEKEQIKYHIKDWGEFTLNDAENMLGIKIIKE